jgi:hypothetical protein
LGRKKSDEKTVPVSFRMPEAMAKSLDAIVAKKSAQAGGVEITRTQVILLALREWLDEQEPSPKTKK